MIVVGCGIAVGAVAALVFMLLGDANVDVVAVLGYAAFGAVIGLFCLPIVFMKRKKIVLWILFVLALGWGLTVLVGSSSGVDMLTFLLGAIGGIAIAIPTIVSFVALLVKGIGSESAWFRSFPWVFVVHCVFLVFVVTAVWFDLPFRARFAMSESVLEKTAVQILAETNLHDPDRIGWFEIRDVRVRDGVVSFNIGEAGNERSLQKTGTEIPEVEVRPAEPAQIGWFDVTNICAWDGAVTFTIGESGLVDEFCLVYCPGEVPTYIRNHGFQHITGHWYAYVDPF